MQKKIKREKNHNAAEKFLSDSKIVLFISKSINIRSVYAIIPFNIVY